MKICNDTMAVLKNFSGINSNLRVFPGSVLKTLAEAKNMLAIASVPESFPVEFGIWDLKQFLAVASSFDDPEYEFGPKSVTISSNGASVKYFYSDTSTFVDIPDKTRVGESKFSFTLTLDTIKLLRDLSSNLKFDVAAFVGNDDGIFITAYNSKTGDSTSHRFSKRLADNPDGLKFDLHLELSNLKFLDGEYRVELSGVVGIKLFHTKRSLEYMVALLADSSWGEESADGSNTST